YALAWQHNETFASVPGLGAFVNLNKVSDDTYFADLADRIAITSQSTLPREGGVSYTRGPWAFLARLQSFPTLQHPTTPAVPPDRSDVTTPITSGDGGIVFERDASLFGQSFVQTLEPRAFYVYIPFRDQSKIPVFDSALDDFNFGQLFSENRYLGNDRIGDANQLTVAVSSRLID